MTKLLATGMTDIQQYIIAIVHGWSASYFLGQSTNHLYVQAYNTDSNKEGRYQPSVM